MDVPVKRGQLITTYPRLSRELRLSVKSIRVALQHLKETGEVAVKTYTKFSLITVLNYDYYQASGADKRADKGQTNGSQRADKGQYLKNIRSNKEVKKIVADAPKDGEVRDWEIECKVPAEFIGRFQDKKAWLNFLGEDEDGIPLRFG